MTLYMRAPRQLEEATRANLPRPLASLLHDGDEVTVTDAGTLNGVYVRLRVAFD